MPALLENDPPACAARRRERSISSLPMQVSYEEGEAEELQMYEKYRVSSVRKPVFSRHVRLLWKTLRI